MKLIKIIAINLVVFVLLLAAINWACGLYLKKNDTQVNRDALPNYKDNKAYAEEIFKDYGRVKHQYEPFTGWKCLPYEGKTLTISNDGERVNKTGLCQANAKSIHFFGGSTMWGEGSDDAHTIPAIFNSINGNYEAFNHGQLAYNSRQELDALISLYARNVKPEVVVFYDGVNDAAFLCPKEITQLPAHRLVPMYREKIYAGNGKLLKQFAGKIFIQNIMKVVNKFSRTASSDSSPYDCVANPAKAEAIAEMMMKNWEMAHEIVNSRGGKFIAILQPAAFINKPRTDHLKLDSDLGENFKAIYKNLQAKIAERKHPWIYDLTNRFDGNEYIYIDFCHVSSNGNEIIAKEISSIVRDSSAIASSTR
jgi:hypothetical protein